jgi:hypothetical protein
VSEAAPGSGSISACLMHGCMLHAYMAVQAPVAHTAAMVQCLSLACILDLTGFELIVLQMLWRRWAARRRYCSA